MVKTIIDAAKEWKTHGRRLRKRSLLRRVVCLHRHTEHLKSGKISSETVYLISSLSSEKASPAQLPDINRGHWGIENRNHYVRDVTFDEDRSQVRTKSDPRMMAALRHIAAKPHLCLTLLGI